MTLAATLSHFSKSYPLAEATPSTPARASGRSYLEMDDNTLMEHVQAKEQEAMVALHSRYVNLLYSISLRILHDPTMAEDATQEAFFKVWQSAHQFNPTQGTVPGWLARIARNMAIDRQRMEQRRAAVNTDVEINDEIYALHQPSSSDSHPDEMHAAIRHALDHLPPEQAKLITLSYFGGLSHSDLSEMLGIPLGTVKTRLQMGMARLRAAWKE